MDRVNSSAVEQKIEAMAVRVHLQTLNRGYTLATVPHIKLGVNVSYRGRPLLKLCLELL